MGFSNSNDFLINKTKKKCSHGVRCNILMLVTLRTNSKPTSLQGPPNQLPLHSPDPVQFLVFSYLSAASQLQSSVFCTPSSVSEPQNTFLDCIPEPHLAEH